MPEQLEKPLEKEAIKIIGKPAGRYKILLTGAPRLGDVIFALPAIQWLRANESVNHISVLCYDYAAPLLLPLGPKVGHLRQQSGRWSFIYKRQMIKTIDRQGFHFAIVLDGKKSMRNLLAQTDIPLVLVESSASMHKSTQHLRSIMKSFPINSPLPHRISQIPEVKPPAKNETWAREIVSRWPKPVIAFHVGCRRISGKKLSFDQINRSATKMWLVESYLELAKMLMDQLGATILMVGSGKGEKKLAEEFAKQLGSRCINAVGWGDCMQTAALLKASDVLVASDGGVLHLGCAVGTKVAAVWGPTPIDVFGPRGETAQIKVFWKEVECRPCKKTECDDKICLSSISASEVFTGIVELLYNIDKPCDQNRTKAD